MTAVGVGVGVLVLGVLLVFALLPHPHYWDWRDWLCFPVLLGGSLLTLAGILVFLWRTLP